jgi:hypothetical protein
LFNPIDFSQYNWDVPTEMAITNNALFTTASMFFRKSFYTDNLSFFTSHLCFDYTQKILLAISGTIHIIPEVMTVYRKNTVSSWSKKMKNESFKMIDHLNNSISAINDLDQYTNYQYTELLHENILNRQFKIECLKGNIKALKRPPFLNIYNKMSLVSKFELYSQKYFPWIIPYEKKLWHLIKMKRNYEK